LIKVLVIHQFPDILYPAVGEIVEANHFVVILQQVLAEVGADEAGTTGN